MSKPISTETDTDEMRPEYDFSKAVRGKYAEQFRGADISKFVKAVKDGVVTFRKPESHESMESRIEQGEEKPSMKDCSYITCGFCKKTVPETHFCQSCGKCLQKWCPGCAEWRSATFCSLEVDDSGMGSPVVSGENQEDAKFCPNCGIELQAKSAAQE